MPRVCPRVQVADRVHGCRTRRARFVDGGAGMADGVESRTPSLGRRPPNADTSIGVDLDSRAVRAHVDSFVRTVLGIPLGSDAAVPQMPESLARLLLRIEEFESDERDQWGCWEFGRAENFRRGRLWEPEVDRWIVDARSTVDSTPRAPLWPNAHRFVVCLSHDVDMVTRTWTPRQIARSIRLAATGSAYRPLTATDRALAVARAFGRAARFRTRFAPSSAETLQRCVEIEIGRGVTASYFFTVYPPEPSSVHDCVYTAADPVNFRGARRSIGDVARALAADGFDVGLHGSYWSSSEPSALAAQRRMLEDVIGQDVRTTRQHWLHWDARTTPTVQERAGLTADSTLGYNRNVGFRAGTSFPFFLAAANPFRTVDVLEVPLVVQEAALFALNALELDEALARDVLRTLLERVAGVNGIFSLLVHPHSLLDERVVSLYTWVLDYALDEGAWVASVADIEMWWRSRANELVDAVDRTSSEPGVARRPRGTTVSGQGRADT